MDEQTGKRLIDEILDVAKQKGTGMWTSQSAMKLQVPAPTIDAAVRDARYVHASRRNEKKPVAFCRDLSAGLKATIKCLSANCGARFTPG